MPNDDLTAPQIGDVRYVDDELQTFNGTSWQSMERIPDEGERPPEMPHA